MRIHLRIILLLALAIISLRKIAAQSCDAGTMQVLHTEDRSPANPSQTIDLCYGNSLTFVHNGDADLSQDPDGSTPAGIAYMVFTSRPTTTGSDWNTILSANNALQLNGGPYLLYGDRSGSQALLHNTDALNAPTTLWVAPVTINDFAAALLGDPAAEGAGCVHLNTNAAIEVRLLSRIEVTIDDYAADAIAISVNGGLPATDGSNYSVQQFIQNNSGLQIIETLSQTVSAPINTRTTLSTDTLSYRYRVTDDAGCYTQFGTSDNNQAVDSIRTENILLESGCVQGKKGDTIDVPFYMRNIDELGLILLDMEINPSQLEYVGFINHENAIPSFIVNTEASGQIITVEVPVTSPHVLTNPDDLFFSLRFVIKEDPGHRLLIRPRSSSSQISDGSSEFLSHSFVPCDILVVQEDPAVINFDFAACASDGGVVDLALSNVRGVGPYTLDIWDNAGTSILANPSTFDSSSYSLQLPNIDPSANPHTLVLQGSDGSELRRTIEFQILGIDLEYEVRNPSCGATNGQIDVTDIFNIDDNNVSITLTSDALSNPRVIKDQADALFDKLSPGLYTLTVEDTRNGCSISLDTLLRDVRPNFEIDVDNAAITSCNDPSQLATVAILVKDFEPTPNGQLIELRITKDNEAPQFFSNVLFDTGALVVRLPVGNYTLLAKDRQMPAACTGDTTLSILPSSADSTFPILDTIITPQCDYGGNNPSSSIVYKLNRAYQNMSISVSVTRDGLPPISFPDIMFSSSPDSLVDIETVTGRTPLYGTYNIRIMHPDFCLPFTHRFELEKIDLDVFDRVLFDCPGGRGSYLRIDSIGGQSDLDIGIVWERATDTVPYVPGIENDNLPDEAGLSFFYTVIDLNSTCANQQTARSISGNAVTFTVLRQPTDLCPGASDGYVDILIDSMGTLDSIQLKYLSIRDDSVTYIGPFRDSVRLENLKSGTFLIIGYSNGGCPSQERGQLFEVVDFPEILSTNGIITQQPRCAGDMVEILLEESDLTSSRIDPNLISYSILTPNDPVPLGTPIMRGLQPGSYVIYLLYNGCTSDGLDSFSVRPGASPMPELTQDEYNLTNMPPDLIQLMPGQRFSTYAWVLGGDTLYRQGPQFDLTSLPQTISSNLLELYVTDMNGCTGQTSARLRFDIDGEMQYPNVFRAGIDLFRPRFAFNSNLESVQGLEIYNRQGAKVWEAKNVDPGDLINDMSTFGWDGTNDGQQLPSDVYVFIVKVKYTGRDQIVPWSGSVLLVR